MKPDCKFCTDIVPRSEMLVEQIIHFVDPTPKLGPYWYADLQVHTCMEIFTTCLVTTQGLPWTPTNLQALDLVHNLISTSKVMLRFSHAMKLIPMDLKSK